MKYCSNCGTPLDDGSRFCPNCGQQLQETVNPASPNEGTQMASEAPGEVVLSSWENPNPKPQPQPQPQPQPEPRPQPQQNYPQGGGYYNNQPQGRPVQTAPVADMPNFGNGRPEKKKKKRGCGCVLAIILAIVVIVFVASYFYYKFYVK